MTSLKNKTTSVWTEENDYASAISQTLSIKCMHSRQLRHDYWMNGVICTNFSCRSQLKSKKGKRKNKSQTI